MKYFSVFTGVGGFEQGMPKDFECVGFSEIDRYANMVLKYHYPNIKNYGDISKIDWQTVPDFDLLVGGSPCQDLSVAGKQNGLSGKRSGLFFEFVRALEHKKPHHFIWENVKGALSSNGGRDFAIILRSMAEAGYSLWWQVLNAKDFGVPQNRERVFVVGSRNRPAREVFFEQGTTSKDQGIVCPTIRATHYKSGDNQPVIRQLNNPKHSNDRVYSQEGLSPTLNTMQGGMRQPFIAVPVITPNRLEKRQNGRRMKENGEPAFTLNAQDQHGVYDGQKIRRLTPIECERLMGWKDEWTRYGMREQSVIEISDTQRYKMCGNGVVSNIIRWLTEVYFNQ
jgi:DNA (cytosine-5)-methyltransferase 1